MSFGSIGWIYIPAAIESVMFYTVLLHLCKTVISLFNLNLDHRNSWFVEKLVPSLTIFTKVKFYDSHCILIKHSLEIVVPVNLSHVATRSKTIVSFTSKLRLSSLYSWLLDLQLFLWWHFLFLSSSRSNWALKLVNPFSFSFFVFLYSVWSHNWNKTPIIDPASKLVPSFYYICIVNYIVYCVCMLFSPRTRADTDMYTNTPLLFNNEFDHIHGLNWLLLPTLTYWSLWP